MIYSAKYDQCDFSKISNDLIQDKHLSLQARGLLCYMLSRNDDWIFSAQKLQEETGERRTRIESALRELETQGYIKIIKEKKKGRFQVQFIIFEKPQNNQALTTKQKHKNINESNFGYVYVIKMQNSYKIGITRNPDRRFNQFLKLPYPIEEIMTVFVPDYTKKEEFLHYKYKDKNINGEWFDLSETDLDFIKEYLYSEQR